MRVLCLAPALLSADCPTGCPSKCPVPVDIQTQRVKESLDISKFWGTYYEIAYHDNTQPRSWPIKADCMRSVKSAHPDDPTKYKDLFSLNFGSGSGMNAICDLEFNVTKDNGIFIGHWETTWRKDLSTVSNTLVDVGVQPNGTYSWTLEFQCTDDPTKGITFAAINFYHRNPVISDQELSSMETILRGQGLGWVIDVSPGMTKVNQQKCIDNDSYPAVDAKPYFCGQSMADVVV
jgi:hypothetical protein